LPSASIPSSDQRSAGGFAGAEGGGWTLAEAEALFWGAGSVFVHAAVAAAIAIETTSAASPARRITSRPQAPG
jgi:hypothetical protein